jgi:hypothetical protein
MGEPFFLTPLLFHRYQSELRERTNIFSATSLVRSAIQTPENVVLAKLACLLEYSSRMPSYRESRPHSKEFMDHFARPTGNCISPTPVKSVNSPADKSRMGRKDAHQPIPLIVGNVK